MNADMEHMWKSPEPAQREVEEEEGSRNASHQMVFSSTTMRVPARTKELIAARAGETLSRETLRVSPHIYHHPFVLSNEMGWGGVGGFQK